MLIGAKTVAGPLLDGECHVVAALRLVEGMIDRDDPEIGVTMAHIVAPQRFLVGLELASSKTSL